jgi:hypothetical protein
MKQKRILVPTDGPETWKQFLAEPEKHWKSGYSAMSTAHSWERAMGVPTEISALFRIASDEVLHDASLALAIPEYQVSLAGGTRPSQNDVFALLSCTGGLIAMMVEGKAREDFDAPLVEWKRRTSPQGVKARMAEIMDNIGINRPIPDEIRYQLLHRTASAMIEARRFHAPYAVIVIQSFVAADNENHYDDFCKFIRLFEKEPMKEALIEISRPHGRKLFAAWVQSEPT